MPLMLLKTSNNHHTSHSQSASTSTMGDQGQSSLLKVSRLFYGSFGPSSLEIEHLEYRAKEQWSCGIYIVDQAKVFLDFLCR